MFKENFTLFYQISVIILLLLICIKLYTYSRKEKYEEQIEMDTAAPVDCSSYPEQDCPVDKGCESNGQICVSKPGTAAPLVCSDYAEQDCPADKGCVYDGQKCGLLPM